MNGFAATLSDAALYILYMEQQKRHGGCGMEKQIRQSTQWEEIYDGIGKMYGGEEL